MEFLSVTVNALLDRPTKDIVGGLMVALVIAMAAAGVFALARRKVGDSLMLVTVLGLLACVASMVLTLGTIERSRKVTRETIVAPEAGRGRGMPPGGPGLEVHLASRILAVADTDRDGVLSEQEASKAAAEFARASTAKDARSLDTTKLARSIRDAFFFPNGPMGPPPPGFGPMVRGPSPAPEPDKPPG